MGQMSYWTGRRGNEEDEVPVCTLYIGEGTQVVCMKAEVKRRLGRSEEGQHRTDERRSACLVHCPSCTRTLCEFESTVVDLFGMNEEAGEIHCY